MVLTLTTYALSFKENHQHLNMEESFTPFQNKEEKKKKKKGEGEIKMLFGNHFVLIMHHESPEMTTIT